MAELKSDQSSDQEDVEFLSAKKSSDDQESVNMEKVFFGDAFDGLDEEQQEGLKNISKSELQMDTIIDQDDPFPNLFSDPKEESKSRPKLPGQNPENPTTIGGPQAEVNEASSKRSRSSSQNSDPSEDVETNIDVLYTIKARDADDVDVSVLKFSRLYLPDTDKRLKQMIKYNRHIMEDYPQFEDEIGRKRKRDLKENYKKTLSMYQRKAKYLPVNPFLEDFYYLQGYSKSGVAQNKKLQVPQGYRPLYSLQKADNQFLERIIPQRQQGSRRQQLGKSVHFSAGGPADKQVGKDGEAAAKAAEDKESEAKKDFTIEACQINELRSRIIEEKLSGDNADAAGGANEVGKEDSSMAKLRQCLKSAKANLRVKLDQKLPQVRHNEIQRQNFAILSQLNQFYSQQPGSQPVPQKPAMIKKGSKAAGIRGRSIRPPLPSEVEIYEMQIEQKFKQCKIASKRVKYWGELADCVSEHQISRDSHVIKRHEWQDFVRNKQGFKQPIFALISKNQASETGAQGGALGAGKDSLVNGKPSGGHASGSGAQSRLSGAASVGAPTSSRAEGTVQGGQLSRAARRPPPVVVDKSDFDLVTTFEEYEKLKEQEKMHYRQRKKTKVTAESIMRHVRWKLGRLSDQEFYKEELQEMRREEQLEDKAKQQMQRHSLSASQARRISSAINTPQTDLTDAEPKDMESAKRPRNMPIDFEENLDAHFDRKRVEIQERILRKKSEKERASQQKQNTTQTPAYEPIVPQEKQDSESVQGGSDHNNNPSDNESSSSDSDTDSDEAVADRQQTGAGHTMLADELNHAHCIKNLSFFKLNWDNKDLETFHRPNIYSNFLEQSNAQRKIPANAVSVKKEDKETRLNPHLYFKTRFKLSLNKGKFCIFEHIDQHPLFVNNFGMASRLKRYYYGDKQPSKKEFLNQKSENIANRHIGPYGKFIFKDELEKLDLLGQVDKSKYKGLTILENNMYNAPVFYHRIPSTTNDFFCTIVKQNNSNDSRIYVRSLNSFYTVGQIEPKREVYNPQSRHFTHFIKQQSKAYTTRLLQENKVMSFHDIRQFFPQIGSPILKKGLKEIEVEQDRNGLCRLNANFAMERHEDRMTPEMICQFESARHGQYRLEKIGISEILSADKISYSTHKFCFEETDLILQRVAKLIESEVLQTPWNLSSNYIKIKQESSMMMLEGQGDPSYGHGGYSYLKMPLKISADSIQGAKANRMNLNPAIQNPKAVTGTDADLRKLKKLQLQDILQEAGVPENILRTKSRWEMVKLLRSFASSQQNEPTREQGQQNSSTMKSFYARGVRHTSKKQQEMYNKRADSTFRKQMNTLSDVNPPKDLHDLSEDEPDFTKLPDLEAMGLEQIGKGFGTSLDKGKSDKSKPVPEKTKRDPGENAKDFTRDIHILINDDSRKQIVEVEKMPEIKKIEDIKDYLKLFLVIHPNALSPQNQNPSGINIGGVSQNAEFLYAMNGNGSKEWEKKLLEKLQNREISKKCSILCHKIRSLTKDDGQEASFNNICETNKDGEPEKKYERIIFCADEKTIKKFRRCMNKNSLRTPRRSTRRNMTKAYRPLTDKNLNRHDAKDRQGGRSQLRSIGSRSISAYSGKNTASVIQRGSEQKSRRDGSVYDQPASGKIKVGLQNQTQRNSNLQNSGQKTKSKKSRSKPAQLNTQPTLKFNITNNGQIPTAPPPGTSQFAPLPLNEPTSQTQQAFQAMDRPKLVVMAGASPAGDDSNTLTIAGGANANALSLSQPVELQSATFGTDSQQPVLQNKISLVMPNNSQPTSGVIVMSNSQPADILDNGSQLVGEQDDADAEVEDQLDHEDQANEEDIEMQDVYDEIDDVLGNDDDERGGLVDNCEVVSNGADSVYEPEDQQMNSVEEDLVENESSDEYEYMMNSRSKNCTMKYNQKATNLKKAKKKTSASRQQSYLYSHMTSSQSLYRQKSTKSSGRSRKNQSSMQKFQKHGFSNEDFEYQNLTANKSRRRQQQDGTQQLNNIIMEIIDHLCSMNESILFQQQPTRQDAPNYRDLIRCPIAFKDMKNKSKRNEYKESAAFLADIQLMVSNAEKFNGPTHYIANLAKILQERALAQIESKKGDIEAMECVIKMDL